MNEHLTTDLLIDYAHGELRTEDDAFAHAHLASCVACREELEAEVALVEALRADPAFAERELPGAVRGAIWAAADAERPAVASRVAAFFRPVVAVPLAAFAIALAFVALPLGHAPNGPSVDASYYLEAHAAQQAENPFSDRSSSSAMETSMLEGSASPAAASLDSGSGTLAVADPASDLDFVR